MLERLISNREKELGQRAIENYNKNGRLHSVTIGDYIIFPVYKWCCKGELIFTIKGSRLIGADEISRNHLDRTIHVRRNGIETVYNEEDIEVKNDTIEIRG